jgi:hypothetical protein
MAAGVDALRRRQRDNASTSPPPGQRRGDELAGGGAKSRQPRTTGRRQRRRGGSAWLADHQGTGRQCSRRRQRLVEDDPPIWFSGMSTAVSTHDAGHALGGVGVGAELVAVRNRRLDDAACRQPGGSRSATKGPTGVGGSVEVLHPATSASSRPHAAQHVEVGDTSWPRSSRL